MSASALHPYLSAKRAHLAHASRTYVHARLLTRSLLCAFRLVVQYFDRFLYRRDIPLLDYTQKSGQRLARATRRRVRLHACAARQRASRPEGRENGRRVCTCVRA